jgi:hypothetical protein
MGIKQMRILSPFSSHKYHPTAPSLLRPTLRFRINFSPNRSTTPSSRSHSSMSPDINTMSKASKAASTIPTEQWAQVLEAKGKPVVYKRIPVETPGPDEVLVNVKYSGVCHT